MQKIHKLLSKIKSLSEAELLYRAGGDLSFLMEYLEPITGSKDGALSVIASFAAAAAGSDGIFSDKEIEFIAALMHLSFEQAKDILVRACTPQNKQAANGLFDRCESEEKILLLDFCLCFIAVDGNIDRAETDFIKLLIT